MPPPPGPVATEHAPPSRASLDTALRALTEAETPYPCGRWTWRNTSTGELRPFHCARWKCPRCAPRLTARWAALLAAARPQRHVVLTNLGPTNDLATARLKNIIKGIRRGELGRPSTIEYFCSLEGRHRPSIHAHLLQHGTSLPQPALSALASRYRAGAVCWVRSIAPDHTRACHAYVLRHLVGPEHPTQAKTGRRVRYSKGYWHGETRADLAARLWPPAPGPWELLKPDAVPREIAALDHNEARRALHAQTREASDLKLITHYGDAWALKHGYLSLPRAEDHPPEGVAR